MGGDVNSLNEKLERYRAVVKDLKQGYRFISPDHHFEISYPALNESARRISEVLAEEPIASERGETSEEIYKHLFGKKEAETKSFKLEKQVTTGVLVFLSVALVTLVLSQTKLLTGYAISNIPSTTSGIGIFICIAGILGFLYYRNRIK